MRIRRDLIQTGLLIAVVSLVSGTARAQGTMTYLSNLGQLSNGSNAVGSDSWLAALFYTGVNAAGYSLDSVQLEMADASGSPSDFTAMIYGMNSKMIGGVFPGSSLGTLDGSLDPAMGDIYTFTAISNLLLSPGTPYFIVLTAGTPVASGAFAWNYSKLH